MEKARGNGDFHLRGYGQGGQNVEKDLSKDRYTDPTQSAQRSRSCSNLLKVLILPTDTR